MGDLLIRNISNAVRAELKKLAEEKGQSLTETAREALRTGTEVMSRRGEPGNDATPPGKRLRQIFSGAFESDEEYEAFKTILDEIRHGPDRPAPEFD